MECGHLPPKRRYNLEDMESHPEHPEDHNVRKIELVYVKRLISEGNRLNQISKGR
jgi:hypothetical protein